MPGFSLLDHIDENKLNNRLNNLRPLSSQLNSLVSTKRHIDKELELPRGVSIYKKSRINKYRARFRDELLGYYKTIAEAEKVYIKRKNEYMKEIQYV